ncbi:hypothetical protein K9M79_04310 [Candidatus Woesearchaeota archaeon]|nr:hypothetical protein [Candidatus Woesearchaeota archaeon]
MADKIPKDMEKIADNLLEAYSLVKLYLPVDKKNEISLLLEKIQEHMENQDVKKAFKSAQVKHQDQVDFYKKSKAYIEQIKKTMEDWSKEFKDVSVYMTTPATLITDFTQSDGYHWHHTNTTHDNRKRIEKCLDVFSKVHFFDLNRVGDGQRKVDELVEKLMKLINLAYVKLIFGDKYNIFVTDSQEYINKLHDVIGNIYHLHEQIYKVNVLRVDGENRTGGFKRDFKGKLGDPDSEITNNLNKYKNGLLAGTRDIQLVSKKITEHLDAIVKGLDQKIKALKIVQQGYP